MNEFPSNELNSIWAPWRFEYFSIDKGRDFFSEAAATSDDAAHLVLVRRKSCFLMMNRYPYSVGHLMVIPYRKISDLGELTDQEKIELFDLAAEGQELLRTAVKAQGFNVGFNIGSCGGAGYADHLHLHIVPRWTGDNNFMAVIGGTRIQAEPIDQAYARLAAVRDARAKTA